MRVFQSILVAGALALGAGACTSTLDGRQLAEYCADPRKSGKDLCAVNTEIQSVRSDLAVTDRKAGDALELARQAKTTADEANAKNVVCATKTISRAQSGSCDPGYTLMGCTQTRYTHAAGGLSVLRAVDDQSCRFNTRVLEMQVRCCQVGVQTQTAAAEQPQPAQPQTPQPSS